MTTMFIFIALVILAGANLFFWLKLHSLEYDLDAALNAVAMQTKALSDLKAETDGFKEHFDEVIAEAEKQNELEAQWNVGLNNILNYSLADSYKARQSER